MRVVYRRYQTIFCTFEQNQDFDNLDFHFLNVGNYAPLGSVLIEGDRRVVEFFKYF